MFRLAHRRILRVVVAALVLGLAGAVALSVHGRLTSATPAATVSIIAPDTLTVPAGSPPPVPLPATGSLALATSLDGTVARLGANDVRPIASVAKTMTALVVLDARPLAPGATGPAVTMTSSDVVLYDQALASGGSAVRVTSGEVLSERDLLLALLLPSGNNIAETLARWVSGSRAAFIARLNGTAAAMGMASTHFADPSGFSARTVSTAADLVVLARATIADASLADLVSTQSWTLPDGTRLTNLDTLLGSATGWLGIKTGWTGAAGGCLIFAEARVIGPVEVTVYGAVLGQPPDAGADSDHPELGGAFTAAQAAAEAALGAYGGVDLASDAPAVAGRISTSWGGDVTVAVAVPAPDRHIFRVGTVLRITVAVSRLIAPLATGARIGTMSAMLGAQTVATWPLVTSAPVVAPSWWWKLLNG